MCVAWPVVVRVRVTVVIWVVVVAVLVMTGMPASAAVTFIASAGTVGVALASRLTRGLETRSE